MLEEYKLITHRGLHEDGAPENSLLAFSKSAQSNYAIELDVHATKDGHVVVFHDYNLKRMTGVDKIVEESTLEEIKELYLDNTAEKIPTLMETLACINGKVPLLIEMKNERFPGLLEKKLLEILKDYDGKYMVQSFNMLSVRWFKKNAPNILRGKLATKTKRNLAYKIDNIIAYIIAKPDFVSYRFEDISERLIKICKTFKLDLICWTVRSKEDYIKASKFCSGIIFENFKI
ncbi:MAG: glycerophosphodiester phosphodiesterase family protein [Clostridia bacterium]